MRIFAVVPPGECLRVEADMVLFAGNTVWSISERFSSAFSLFAFKVDDEIQERFFWRQFVGMIINYDFLFKALYLGNGAR